MPEESKMVMSALAESMAWQTGSVISTRLSKTSCRSSKKSCLKRVILEASGTLVKPQNHEEVLSKQEKLKEADLLE